MGQHVDNTNARISRADAETGAATPAAPAVPPARTASRAPSAIAACVVIIAVVGAVVGVAILVTARAAVTLLGVALLLAGVLRPFTAIHGVLLARNRAVDAVILLGLGLALLLLSPAAEIGGIGIA